MLAGVHLPSKLYNNGNQLVEGRHLIEALIQSEKEVQHEKIFVIGDFNAGPYEDLMSSFEYMHAIYDAGIVQKRKERTVCEEKKPLFYNPEYSGPGEPPILMVRATYSDDESHLDFWSI